ncbi:uncharacterized protein LOC117168703 [Belonocnema kinseyi]|uniref:uncharacterized protein LOC117168703 n=1 Tax=Belonocnema kinseyi TaxID=2817044 RepID=UPI00143D61D1|nr:uncharacterized protein LOC117168703 [Belonocnema kinseyi]
MEETWKNLVTDPDVETELRTSENMDDPNRNTKPVTSEPTFLNEISSTNDTKTQLELEAAYAILCERLSNHKACIGQNACLLCKLKKITSQVISFEEEKLDVPEKVETPFQDRGTQISQEGSTEEPTNIKDPNETTGSLVNFKTGTGGTHGGTSEPTFLNGLSIINETKSSSETSSSMTLKSGLKWLRIVNNMQKKNPNDPLTTDVALQVLEAVKNHLLDNCNSIPKVQDKMSPDLKEISLSKPNRFHMFGVEDVRLIKLLYLLHIFSILLLSCLFVHGIYN